MKISRLQGQRTRVENFILKFLNQLNIENAILYIKDFFGANLGGTNFRGAGLLYANLNSADLRRANLRNAFLSRAELSETDLRGADLRGAELRGAKVTKEQLKGAIIDKTTNLPWSDEKS